MSTPISIPPNPQENRGGPQFPRPDHSIAPSSRPVLDEALAALANTKNEWATLAISERIALLRQIIHELDLLAESWIGASLAAKGLLAGSFGEGEEWIIFSALVRNVQQYLGALLDIERYGRPRIARGFATARNGRVIAKVFPASLTDALLFQGMTADVWMRPGVSAADVEAGQALVYRETNHVGRVALVLGAGNVGIIAPADAMAKLFAENQVVILKMNPVNAYLGPLLERAFRALIERGFLRIVYGGAAEGAYLCTHPAVDTVHLTGSDKTFEAVMFGTGDSGQRRKANGIPLLAKPVTGELSGVNPVIIIPCPWTSAELRRQSIQLAGWQVVATGFACLTPRVLVQHRQWEHRDALVAAMRDAFSSVPTRLAYYPGAHERHAKFLAAYPEALMSGERDEHRLPWTIIPDVDPSRTGEIAFTQESFCSICAETALEAPTTAQYIRRAVDFANTVLWGNLCAVIIVHPRSLREPGVREALDEALLELRYGTICVNLYPGMAYALMAAPWGAFPGNQPADIQSGTGWVNNTLLLDLEHPEKVVFRAPFKRVDPTLLTFRHIPSFGRQLARFSAAPSPTKLLRLTATALRHQPPMACR